MKVIILPPLVEVLASPTYEEALYIVERAARTCYQSMRNYREERQASEAFIGRLIRAGHHSVLEHVVVTLRFVTDRGVTHELVRHRVGVAYSQESTRYVRHDGVLYVIEPYWWGQEPEDQEEKSKHMYLRTVFADFCVAAATAYQSMLNAGASTQQARAVLPHATKTEIIVTANLREWRHILTLRCASEAHPDMRRVMRRALQILYERFPVFFEDLTSLLA